MHVTVLRKALLPVCWLFRRALHLLSSGGRKIARRRKTIYETRVEPLTNFDESSPFGRISIPPWKLRVSGVCLVLTRYVASQIYNCARSNRWMEIYGFVLGKRFGNLFVGVTFIEITNALRSSDSALPEHSHVLQFRREIAARYPDLEIVAEVHSHPSGALIPSEQDRIAFMEVDYPNIIVSPGRLLFGSPLRRMAAFYPLAGKVRRIRILETGGEDAGPGDVDLSSLEPSREELLNSGEIVIEADFGIFKTWVVAHPGATVRELGLRLSRLFGGRIRFLFLHREENGWVHNPGLRIAEYFLKEGEHLLLPETPGGERKWARRT